MLYRILMTFSAIATMPVIYIIKSGYCFVLNSRIITGVIVLLVPIFVLLFSIVLIHRNEEEDLSQSTELEMVTLFPSTIKVWGEAISPLG